MGLGLFSLESCWFGVVYIDAAGHVWFRLSISVAFETEEAKASSVTGNCINCPRYQPEVICDSEFDSDG